MKTFNEWLNHQQPEGSEPGATTFSRTTKTKRDRDRLTRMEALLPELVHMKQMVERRTRHDNA
jgi:hypothetical protein